MNKKVCRFPSKKSKKSSLKTFAREMFGKESFGKVIYDVVSLISSKGPFKLLPAQKPSA